VGLVRPEAEDEGGTSALKAADNEFWSKFATLIAIQTSRMKWIEHTDFLS